MELLHPDDVLFFNEVREAMFRVAKDYKLPLHAVVPQAVPLTGRQNAKGTCGFDGKITLVMRCSENGEWCDASRTPEEVWATAAHELAHLRHMDHSEAFHEFRLEMLTAIRNQKMDHREKVIAKLIKMQATKDSEKALGNVAAAEAFAAAINRMLLENELSPSDVEYAKAGEDDPVIQVEVKLKDYGIESKRTRVAWQETLARMVAKAHLCTFLIQRGTNRIIFVGTKSHALVAEYAFGTLVPAAEKMSLKARHDYRNELRAQHGIAEGKSLRGIKEGFGFREAWLDAFAKRIGERFEEARNAAIQAATPEGESTSTALIRLDGAMAKVHRYIDDRFSHRRSASALNGRRHDHPEGRARGTAAADAVTLRRGIVGGSNNSGLLSA